MAQKLKNVVLVDGCRTPFLKSFTHFNKLWAHDLQRAAISGLMKRTGIQSKDLDHVICGTVIAEPKTSNIAREAALGANISDRVPAHTVTLACISSNVAINQGMNMIMTGQADAVIAGGVETMSDVPIRFGRKMRATMLSAQKGSLGSKLGKFAKLGMKDLTPELPAIAEFSTNEIMGASADRLAAAFGISREEQDAFAIRSHQNAQNAKDAGILAQDIVPVMGPKGHVTEDNMMRVGTIEELGKLRAAFQKPHGTITAGNSSAFTDGASATLLMSEEKALALGMKPKAYLRECVFVSQDPKDQLLLGPAYATDKVLGKAKLTLKDMDVLEYHEAFAGQLLACLKAIQSDKWCQDNLGRKDKIGDIDMDKLNTEGGSLSLGHPFGATGARLITTAANRLQRENGKYALVAACAAGGHGVGAIVERYGK